MKTLLNTELQCTILPVWNKGKEAVQQQIIDNCLISVSSVWRMNNLMDESVFKLWKLASQVENDLRKLSKGSNEHSCVIM